MSLSKLTGSVSEHGLTLGFPALWGTALLQFIAERLTLYIRYFVMSLAAAAASALTHYRFLYFYVPPAAVIAKRS